MPTQSDASPDDPLGALGRTRVDVASRMKVSEETGPVLKAGPMAAFADLMAMAAMNGRVWVREGMVVDLKCGAELGLAGRSWDCSVTVKAVDGGSALYILDWLHEHSGENGIILIQNKGGIIYTKPINQMAVVALQNNQFIYPTRWTHYRFRANHSFLNELNSTTNYFSCNVLFDIF